MLENSTRWTETLQEDTTDIQFRRNARWAAQGTQKAVAEAKKAKASA
jgi:hypothetical protein